MIQFAIALIGFCLCLSNPPWSFPFANAVVANEPTPAIAETRAGIIVQAEIDELAVALSGERTLSLSVTGPAPLSVTPAKWLLTPESAQAWLVNERAAAAIENLPDGRQRWRQQFRLRPYAPGPDIRIALAPIKVSAGMNPETAFVFSNDLSVAVTTTIDQPTVESMQPITGVEPVPAAGEKPVRREQWVIVEIVAIATIVTFLLVYLLVRSVRPAPICVHDVAWGLAELANLPREPAARFHAGLANVIRSVLQDVRHVPALQLTTAELSQALRGAGLSGSLTNDIQSILENCDQQKFSGAGHSTSDNSQFWIDRAVQTLNALISSSPPAELHPQ